MGALMSINLNELSLKELKDLQGKVARAIDEFQDRKKREAIAVLEERAQKLGFSLSELLVAAPARKRMAARAKYANPAHVGETWTGRGRKPRWVEAAHKSGKSLADLLL
jgi:DNA-binding protein H-NS